MPIFDHGTTTLKSPSNVSQKTYQTQASAALNHTISSFGPGPSLNSRLDMTRNRAALRTHVGVPTHKRVQSSDYHTLQTQTMKPKRRVNLNQSFATPSSANQSAFLNMTHQFDTLQVGTFSAAPNEYSAEKVKYAHMPHIVLAAAPCTILHHFVIISQTSAKWQHSNSQMH